MRGGGESKREGIARDILNYLLHHPAAADTLEGIARWRILEEIAKRNLAATEEAMRWLIAQGFLREEKIAGGRALYKLDAARRREAELFLKERDKKPGVELKRSRQR